VIRDNIMIPRGRWCDIGVLNVFATNEDKVYSTNNSAYNELDRVFYQFHNCHVIIL
jgi:hypothetical protein